MDHQQGVEGPVGVLQQQARHRGGGGMQALAMHLGHPSQRVCAKLPVDSEKLVRRGN